MSDRWKLAIYHPGSNSPDSPYTDTSPGGIVDGFEWTLTPTGASKQLRFRAVPSMTDLPPRALVELDVGGERQFRGILVQTWSPQDTNVREYVAVGLELLVQQDVTTSLDITEADPADWFYNLADALALAGTWFEVGDTEQDGSTLAMENYQGLPASKVFDDLARSCQHTRAWWLTLDGYAVFKDPTGNTLTIAADDPGLEWRAEDSTETYDRVELYLLSKPWPDGAYPTWTPAPSSHRPALWQYRLPDSPYHSTRVLTPPNQLDMLERMEGGTIIASPTSGWTDIDNINDGDDSTYATYQNTGSSNVSIYLRLRVAYDEYEDYPPYWGRVRFRTSGNLAAMMEVQHQNWSRDQFGDLISYSNGFGLDLGESTGVRVGWLGHPWRCVKWPYGTHDHRAIEVMLHVADVPPNGTVTVYSVDAYRYSQAAMERYASHFVRLPVQYPGAYVQQQLQNTGVWEVTVTDLAGEDRTFRVSEIQNRYTIESGAWSRIVFGGDALGEAARMVQIRDQRVHDSALLGAASGRRQA